MIDPDIKRVLGQLTSGVNVVACRRADLVRAYTSHWTYQLSFEDPVVGISVSPKHDTYELIDSERWFSVSLLAGDQIEQGQYFSYPGHRFRYVGDYLVEDDGVPYIEGCVGWMKCDIFDQIQIRDHTLFLADVTRVEQFRIKEPALTYSARKGWRIADTPAREKGVSIRDKLLDMVERRYPGDADDS